VEFGNVEVDIETSMAFCLEAVFVLVEDLWVIELRKKIRWKKTQNCLTHIQLFVSCSIDLWGRFLNRLRTFERVELQQVKLVRQSVVQVRFCSVFYLLWQTWWPDEFVKKSPKPPFSLKLMHNLNCGKK
jgi:hypothetical protein